MEEIIGYLQFVYMSLMGILAVAAIVSVCRRGIIDMNSDGFGDTFSRIFIDNLWPKWLNVILYWLMFVLAAVITIMVVQTETTAFHGNAIGNGIATAVLGKWAVVGLVRLLFFCLFSIYAVIDCMFFWE